MMQVLSNAQILAWDAYTISHEPILSIDLMERASHAFVQEFIKLLLPQKELQPRIGVFCGQGNNGGDGLAIARLLHQQGVSVQVVLLKLKSQGTPEQEINLKRIQELSIPIIWLENEQTLNSIPYFDYIIEALFGIGINKPLQGLALQTLTYLNSLPAIKVAVDVPSPQLKVAFTFTFEVLKYSLLFAETGANAGKVKVIPIGLHPRYLSTLEKGDSFFNTFETPNHSINSQFAMKWEKGHALLIGGSLGMIGAITLSSKAALSSFCGMVSVYVPKHANNIIQIGFPEALVQTDPHDNIITCFPSTKAYKAIGIGPGLGRDPETQNALKDFLLHCDKPLLIDADALNLLANIFQVEPNFVLPNNCILTPHQKEFDRLFGTSENGVERLQKQRAFSKKLGIVIVLKGAYTSISDANGICYFNTNGHPLLATAGSGDVLTGIITALLASGETPIIAARKGVFLHAQAAQQLAQKGHRQIIASTLISELGFLAPIL